MYFSIFSGFFSILYAGKKLCFFSTAFIGGSDGANCDDVDRDKDDHNPDRHEISKEFHFTIDMYYCNILRSSTPNIS